jgi:predicted CoA-binding protein
LKKTLAEKLDIREGFRIAVVNPPEQYAQVLGRLPPGVVIVKQVEGPLDLVHFFTKSRVELEKNFPKFKKRLGSNGVFWVSWPKVSSKMASDLNETVVREVGLRNGLVDVKVISIDELWSGLKFVLRLKDR